MYLSYSCISSLDIKNPIPCQESSFTQLRSLNGIFLLTDDKKINKVLVWSSQFLTWGHNIHRYDKHCIKDESHYLIL